MASPPLKSVSVNLRQQAAHSSHTLATRTKWKQLLAKLFHLLHYFTIKEHTHTHTHAGLKCV